VQLDFAGAGSSNIMGRLLLLLLPLLLVLVLLLGLSLDCGGFSGGSFGSVWSSSTTAAI
jgi:hypothetical protein